MNGFNVTQRKVAACLACRDFSGSNQWFLISHQFEPCFEKYDFMYSKVL
jgi:hypothetical protein